MKKPFLMISAVSFLAVSTLFAQRANLDREYFNISYVQLPNDPIVDNSKRTYNSNERGLSLSGFSRLNQNGTLDLRFDFHGTQIGEVDIKKDKVEKKDKEGNVTETYYLYSAVVSYKSTATLTINNAANGENSSYNYAEGENYASKTFRSSSAASKFYNNNRYNIRDEISTKHRNQFVNQANNKINWLYGYIPVTTDRSEHFWILGSKKHPETEKHQEASDALKLIFGKMAYDRPVSEISQEVQPYINYFNDLAVQYDKDDKQDSKMRYASYYNNTQIYYFLEQLEKAKEYAEKLIANEYDKKDGKRFLTDIDNLEQKLAANQLDTRHFEVVTEDLSDQPQVQVQQVIMTEPPTESEKTVAFLITATNDTLQTTINVDDLENMSTMAVTLDADGNPTEIYAKDSRKIVLTTGEAYEVSSFSSTILADEAPTSKFVKSIFKGSRIALYEHMGQEYILSFHDGNNGISTMDKDFVFGFAKKLGSFCGDCEELKAKVDANTFNNTKEGLLAFSKEFDSCVNSK